MRGWAHGPIDLYKQIQENKNEPIVKEEPDGQLPTKYEELWFHSLGKGVAPAYHIEGIHDALVEFSSLKLKAV